jgi:hypothetical protein
LEEKAKGKRQKAKVKRQNQELGFTVYLLPFALFASFFISFGVLQ